MTTSEQQEKTKKYERIAVSDRFNLCGVALGIMEFFNVVGYIRPSEYDSSIWKKFLYHIRTVASISFHLVPLIFIEVAALFMFWPDIPRVSGAAFILSANFTHAVKLTTLIVYRDLYISLIDFFVRAFKQRKVKDAKVLQIIISHEKMTFRDIVAVLVLTCLAVIALSNIGNVMDPSGLPLVGWYPFDINPYPVYQIVYAHQMMAVGVAAALNVTLDMFFNNMVIQLCCQFQLLKRDIELIQQIPPDQDEEISRCLHELIDRECDLKRRCVELSQSYGALMLGQFMGSILIICIAFYQFYRATDTDIVTISSIVATILWAIVQAFFYCYYGNEIMIQSQSVARTLMELDWYLFSTKNKKTVIFMIRMSQKPLILRAAGVMNITLDALMLIIKTSYSCFSVIVSKDVNK